jgi:hypothetical protein
MIRFVTVSERYSVHGYQRIGEVQMQMFAVADSTRITVIYQSSAEEQGTFIPRPERFKALQDLEQFPIHVAQFYFSINV